VRDSEPDHRGARGAGDRSRTWIHNTPSVSPPLGLASTRDHLSYHEPRAARRYPHVMHGPIATWLLLRWFRCPLRLECSQRSPRWPTSQAISCRFSSYVACPSRDRIAIANSDAREGTPGTKCKSARHSVRLPPADRLTAEYSVPRSSVRDNGNPESKAAPGSSGGSSPKRVPPVRGCAAQQAASCSASR
jgi:hypothetical protein